MTHDYIGHLDKNPDGTLRGVLVDVFDSRIILTGTRDPAGGYTLTGDVVVPDALKIPGLDE